MTITYTVNFACDNQLLGDININIDTEHPDVILKAYKDAIAALNGYNGNAAQFMQYITEIVKKEHPEMVLLSVNDDRNLSAMPEYTLNINLTQKNPHIRGN